MAKISITPEFAQDLHAFYAKDFELMLKEKFMEVGIDVTGINLLGSVEFPRLRQPNIIEVDNGEKYCLEGHVVLGSVQLLLKKLEIEDG